MQYINSLWTTLQENLGTMPGDEGAIAKITRCIVLIRESLFELKKYVLEKSFKDPKEEINFFKNLLPNFYSLFLFHNRILQNEKLLPPGQENQVKFLEKEIKRLAFYFEQHADWVLYYRSGATHLDELHFLRQNAAQIHSDCDILFDQRFTSPGTYHFSKIKALEHTQIYLDQKLAQIKTSSPANTIASKLKTNLRWTASKSFLIELVYAIYASKPFNDGVQVDIRQIATLFETMFHVDLGNYYRVIQGIRIRKKNRTQGIDDLKESLIRWMDETDLNPRY